MKIEKNRRDFLKGLLAVGVITTTCPSKLLSILKPEELIPDNKGILGIYKLKLSDFPELSNMWGEIRIKVPVMDGGHRKVVITRIPKATYKQDFSSIFELCTHQGHPIYPVNQETETIECTGHGSLFDPTGKYLSGPANKDLEHFKIFYDGGDFLSFECYFYDPTSVEEKDYFIKDIYPNPSDETAILNYGLNTGSQLKIDVIDLLGNNVQELFDGFNEQGSYNLIIKTSDLPNGRYFVKVSSVKFNKMVKLIVNH